MDDVFYAVHAEMLSPRRVSKLVRDKQYVGV
jgi:hypothetical protein